MGDETAISVGIAVKRTNRFVAVSGDVGGISDFVTGELIFFTCATYCSQMWFYATKTGIAIGGVVWEFTFIG